MSFQNLLGALPKGLKRVVFTSSAGVERQGSFPYIILNLFGAVVLPCNCRHGMLLGLSCPQAADLPSEISNETTIKYGYNKVCRRAQVQAAGGAAAGGVRGAIRAAAAGAADGWAVHLLRP